MVAIKSSHYARTSCTNIATTTTTYYPAIKSGFFAQKNLDEAIERNMWDGSLTKLSFAAIEKRLSDRFIDDRALRQDSHSPTTTY